MTGKKKEERAHALLSASSAKKWINCPPSARLEEGIPETESAYAKEGTLAHAICELKLQKLFTDKNMTDRAYKGRLKKLQQDTAYDKASGDGIGCWFYECRKCRWRSEITTE